MAYFCKKCGAVVSGKFCSCCGTRATDSFTDFRRAQTRMEKEFEKRVYSKYSRLGHDSIAAQDFAYRSMQMAFDRLLPNKQLKTDSFDEVSDFAWRKLPECLELAELLFEKIEDAVLKDGA